MRHEALPEGALRNPFAWREALSPAHVSPASTARSSCRHSQASTPRSGLGVNTPPQSPVRGPGSARSSVSNLSARSGASARSAVSARSGTSSRSLGGSAAAAASNTDFLSARTGSAYDTPVSSARLSEFGSVHEHAPPPLPPGRKPRHAFEAAMDAFAPQRAEAAEPPPAPAAADSRSVFSAARHGRHKEVESALKEGFDPTEEDNFGNTLFHVACQNGNRRIAKLSIKYGGDMGAQNLKGNTGLHFLFAYGYGEIAEYFIEKGADEHICNDVGKAPREGIR